VKHRETETGHDALQIECNIDDMNPEFYDYISDKLFKAELRMFSYQI